MKPVATTEQSVKCAEPKAPRLGDIKLGTLIPIGICTLLLIYFYVPTFVWWYGIWMMKESYYSHGILVPLICGFIVWLKRDALKKAVVQPSWLGYIVLIPAMLITILMFWSGGNSVQGLLFPMVVGSVILTLFGRAILRELMFPVGYLYFMSVLPGDILTKASFRIQMLSTISATTILRAVGLEAYREGATISMSNVQVLVGAPCSGFRLLISLAAFVVLFVFLKEGPRWGKAVLLLSILPLSIILNSIRVTMIALVGEFISSEAMHSFHDWSGYIMLVLAFLILSLLARLVKCQKFNSMLASS